MIDIRFVIWARCTRCGHSWPLKAKDEFPETCPACNDTSGQKWTSESNDRNE